jgi:hypothetical protein
MGKTKLIVYMEKSILSSIEKEAISEGRSKSEIAADLIASALANRSGSGGGGTPGIDTDKIREAVSEAVGEVLKLGGSGVPPEALRFLVADVAKTENLLRQISLLLSAGNFKEHAERVRIAEHKSERILKNLKLDAIEDVDRIEMKVLTKEESEQMLKEMGIGVEGSK